MITKLSCIVALALLLGCASDQGTQPAARDAMPRASGGRVPGEYIVTLRPRVASDALYAVYGSFDVVRVQELGEQRFLVRLSRDPGLAAMRSAGDRSPHVQAIQPNFTYRLDK